MLILPRFRVASISADHPGFDSRHDWADARRPPVVGCFVLLSKGKEAGGPAMPYDRRTPAHWIAVRRCISLTIEQQRMLRMSEALGWKLGFVRQAMHDPIPVLFATDSDYIVLLADGSVDRLPDIAIRH